MNDLSYTQNYYLCAINEKGKAPAIKNTKVYACLLAGSITELLEYGCIKENEKKKLEAIKPLPAQALYLQPLYEIIEIKPLRINALAEKYLASISDKNMKKLLAAIGESTAAAGCAEKLEKQGLLKNETRYVPKQESVKAVIEKTRAAFLADGTVSDEVLVLGALLLKSDSIRNYFSKMESDKLKQRIKEIKQSDAYRMVKKILDFIDEAVAMIVALCMFSD